MINYLRNRSALEVYTDGSSKGGIGSWAYIISRRGKCLAEKFGCVPGGDSNTMEFQAAIEALKSAPEGSTLTLFSDSRILIDAMAVGDERPAYQSQISVLKQLSQRYQIKWQWIKGHRGNPFNERCDELCTKAREFY